MKYGQKTAARAHRLTPGSSRNNSGQAATATLTVSGTGGLAIGLLGLAALASALVSAGGPLNLAVAWFRAVNGI